MRGAIVYLGGDFPSDNYLLISLHDSANQCSLRDWIRSGILAEDHRSRLLSLFGGGDDFFFIYPVLVIPHTIGGTEI